jgi:hypothetical protein
MLKPVAVIKTLEDSPLWLDRRLVLAYLRSIYRVWNPRFDIRVGPVSDELGQWLTEQDAQTFVYITAWNPRSVPMEDAVNRQRNALLETRLRESARMVMAGEAVGSAGDWPPEASFWAIDLSAEEAVRLGQAYEQHAILFWERGGSVELWWVALPLQLV